MLSDEQINGKRYIFDSHLSPMWRVLTSQYAIVPLYKLVYAGVLRTLELECDVLSESVAWRPPATPTSYCIYSLLINVAVDHIRCPSLHLCGKHIDGNVS